MRKGFTLLELLVVVGIMGMLAVAASAGYAALRRGMAERAAVAVAAMTLRAAQERAHVDRMPTKVFCYNKLLKEPSGVDDNGVVVGVMTAIRRGGRISYKKGDLLFDEFADLDTTYEPVKDEAAAKKAGSRRLFRFGSPTSSSMDYSVVTDCVISDESAEMVTLFSGSGTPDGTTNLMTSAFLDLGSGTISAGSWKVGDAYAFEFAELHLPNGFIFDMQVPTRAGEIKLIRTITFDPDRRSSDSVNIYSTKPNSSGWPKAGDKPVGAASADSETSV